MNIDVLVAEIGSTTTLVNAFQNVGTDKPEFWGQGQAATSVLDGDVRSGLKGAIDDLCKNKSIKSIEYGEMLATSSAAGGLKMSVHGLVYDMTARAAREAALGAGAILHMVTASRLRRTDLQKIKDISPKLIMIAGGVDYGERETAIYNAELIRSLDLSIPVIYAGNVENQEEIRLIFEDSKAPIYIVENVYPKIDELNVEPARRVIQAAFEEHIIQAPGMEHIRDMVKGPIIPTPGAVMESAKLIYEHLGDLMVIDVGGATTDIHSVTEGSEEISRILISPEPKAKRTVEGDLGVYINMKNIVEMIGREKLAGELGLDIEKTMDDYKFVPTTEHGIQFVERLTKEAVIKATERHAGRIRHVYGPSGRTTLAEGKDLSQIKYIIGTGGALTRLPNRVGILESLFKHNETGLLLFPKAEAEILIDKDYIMASLGVLSKRYKEAAVYFLEQSLDYRLNS
ncbi:GlmL-related ornithine degradation protein [Bacillota bacterium]